MMKRTFKDNCLKVFLPMIGVPDGGLCGRHSLSTSPRYSAYSRDRHQAGSFRRSPGMDMLNDYPMKHL